MFITATNYELTFYKHFSYLFFAQVANVCCLDQLCIVLDQGNCFFFLVLSVMLILKASGRKRSSQSWNWFQEASLTMTKAGTDET